MIQKIRELLDGKIRSPILKKIVIGIGALIALTIVVLILAIIVKYLLEIVIPVIIVGVVAYIAYKFLEKNGGKF